MTTAGGIVEAALTQLSLKDGDVLIVQVDQAIVPFLPDVDPDGSEFLDDLRISLENAFIAAGHDVQVLLISSSSTQALRFEVIRA